MGCHRITISPQVTNPTIILLAQILFGISVYGHPLIALQTAEGGAPQGTSEYGSPLEMHPTKPRIKDDSLKLKISTASCSGLMFALPDTPREVDQVHQYPMQ